MEIVDIILYIGVFVFAMTGALKARTHSMDILGGLVLAFVTAYGGGTIRDLLVGIRPIGWMNNYLSLALVLLASFIVFLSKENIQKLRKTIFLTDAIGIGMFTIGGIERSMHFGANSIYGLLLGVVSATFGGLVADMLSNEVPAVLKNGEMYATTCAIGGILYIFMVKMHFNLEFSMIVSVTVIVTIRILSKLKNWSIPNM